MVVDITKKEDSHEALKSLDRITHVFYATWLKMPTEVENCKVNAAMMGNLLDNLPATYKHFVLVTGTKHYMGSPGTYAQLRDEDLETPFKETLPRQPGANFYYALEDTLFEKAADLKFSWSVARPHIVIGYAPGNQMNFLTSVAVYASICKYTGQPFIFPDKKKNYYVFLDATDAEAILAEHLMWQATDPAAANQVFNIVNGDVFRWKSLWPKIAEYFGVKPVGPEEPPINLTEKMAALEHIWVEIVEEYGLQKYALADISTWWMVSSSSSREVNCLTDMTKSREMGFLKYQSTEKSKFNLFDTLRREKIIP